MKSNFDFTPKPISAEFLRLGDGSSHHLSIGLIQGGSAIRAYERYVNCQGWMEKLSVAYVVALSTRSADALLMHHIQSEIEKTLIIKCKSCKEATMGLSLIRERLFPNLKKLRESANKLVHHQDTKENKGVSELDIEGVFNYCHHLFHENCDALFGTYPVWSGKFSQKTCKKCRGA